MAKRSLHEQQNSMGLYLRDPDHCAPPSEMDPARARVYRDLVFANLSSLISGTFPVLVKILGDEHWRALVRIFLRDYRAHTPKFGEIAEEFVEFLASGPEALVDGPWPPFMVELAHYEWVEMALQQAEDEPLSGGDADGLLERPLQVSPLAWPLAYAWPVQLLGPQYRHRRCADLCGDADDGRHGSYRMGRSDRQHSGDRHRDHDAADLLGRRRHCAGLYHLRDAEGRHR